MKKINLLLADDHSVLQESLSNSLSNLPLLNTIQTCSNGAEVIQLIATGNIDMVLLDINMPEIDGLTTCKTVKEMAPEVKVIILTMHNDKQYITKAIAAQCDGFLLKSSGLEDIHNALQSVSEGKKYFSAEVMQIMANDQKSNVEQSDIILTAREIEVLKMIVAEYSNKEIAEQLFISPRTVDAHKRNLLAKTGSKNLAGLVKYAISNHLTE